MLRLIIRGVGLLILIFLLVPAGFSKNLAKKARKELKKADDTTSATSSDSTATSDTAKAYETGASNATSTVAPAPPSQSAANERKDTDDDYKPTPRFSPKLARTGTIGRFTLETADTLPKHGF